MTLTTASREPGRYGSARDDSGSSMRYRSQPPSLNALNTMRQPSRDQESAGLDSMIPLTPVKRSVI